VQESVGIPIDDVLHGERRLGGECLVKSEPEGRLTFLVHRQFPLSSGCPVVVDVQQIGVPTMGVGAPPAHVSVEMLVRNEPEVPVRVADSYFLPELPRCRALGVLCAFDMACGYGQTVGKGSSLEEEKSPSWVPYEYAGTLMPVLAV
jgi:hypothetical protein